ncbi:MAG: 50S ribosomal protein L4, partial [Deltaproteobacteria bacterium]|nr:50S ribosomal protein L4 [Deltaproteobacteria bacterium]
IHTVVVAQMAARRAGSAATKNRALVSGGGRKPFKQKGTGRARAGTIRAAQWSGGGVVFGPQPRSYTQRIPKKVRKAAMRSALSLRNREGRIKVVDSFELSDTKTKLMAERLRELGVEDALIVTAERDQRLELAGRNLPRVRVLPVAGLNVRDIVARENLVLTREAADAIVERLR